MSLSHSNFPLSKGFPVIIFHFLSKNLKDVEIAMKFQSAESVYSYSIQNQEGTNLLSQERISVNESFKYLDFLANDMNSLVIRCYDQSGNEKYTAYFNPLKYEIYIIDN